ncbi:hypothetical protein EFT48_01425 [Limosilactobacillus fermentum]|nr:hypothetical protein [Limosilactobacillus fermentum]MCS8618801.1 hypothetical protein [Limosilactobacillus fermentum]MCT3445172.1 hypothetical protein [Limosilactobacillus fermentum]MCT3456627.1 hypothetical protein [Limosilactobacillus fermentum]MCT4373964.1 hypothetical protein [Limosilactobacillus fermentum]
MWRTSMPAASNSASNEKLQPIKNLAEFKQLSLNYVRRFNNERISLKTKGMTPVQYREHALQA